MGKNNRGNLCCMEKKISIQSHHTSSDLKDEIRKAVSDYGDLDWNLVNVSIKGKFIYLTFRKHLTKS